MVKKIAARVLASMICWFFCYAVATTTALLPILPANFPIISRDSSNQFNISPDLIKKLNLGSNGGSLTRKFDALLGNKMVELTVDADGKIIFKLPAELPAGLQNLRIIIDRNSGISVSAGQFLVQPIKSSSNAQYLMITDTVFDKSTLKTTIQFYLDSVNDPVIFENENVSTSKKELSDSIAEFIKLLDDDKIKIEPVRRLQGEDSDIICGRYLTRISGVVGSQDKLISYLTQILRSTNQENIEYRLAPTGLTTPTESGGNFGSYTVKTNPKEVNMQNMQQVKLLDRNGNRYSNLPTGKNTIIFIVDTSNGTDNYKSSKSYNYTLNGQQINEFSYGHGNLIAQVISDKQYGVAPNAEIRFKKACDSSVCEQKTLITKLCELKHYITTTRLTGTTDARKRFIINLSLGGLTDSPILNGVLKDLVRAGAAISIAYGNNDECIEQKYPENALCPYYPAQYVDQLERKNVYSVGNGRLNDAGNLIVSPSTRGAKYDNSGPYETGSSATVFAPGDYFFPNFTNGKINLYSGTSFSAPVVAGALALWSECHPNSNWPTKEQLVTIQSGKNNFLNINYLIKQCKRKP